MSNTSVTATISAVDHASPILDALLKKVHGVGAETDKLGQKIQDHSTRQLSALDKFHNRFSQVSRAVNEAAVGMFAGFGAHFLHEASHVATEMSGLERKMMAFAGLSKRQADEIRRATDTAFSGSTGGPTGQMELATQLLNNGVKANQIQGLMQPISLYAMETNQGLGEAATEFSGHMAMLHRVHDDDGKEISIGMATPEQAKRAAELTFGALTTFFKEMQGSFKDVMEFSKVAAPSSNMLKVPEHFMFAEEAVLSQQGIRGEVAGTAVAGFNRRLINRTAKSRAAMAEAGLNYSNYVQVDPERITAKGVLDAFMQRAGTADAATQAKIKASVEAFHKDRDLDKFNIALTDDFIHSGNKGLQNRVAASNAAGDITQGSISAVDQLKFLQDVKDKNVGFGLLQPMFREATNAVLLMAQNVDELKRIKGVYDKADNQETYDAAKREQFDNYAGAQQNFHGAVSGLQDQLFQPLEGPLTHVFNIMADGIRGVAGASDSAKTIMDAVLVTGTSLASLKVAGTLAEMAGGLMKFATGAEEVGPLVGALGLLADVPFIPIVAGVGALVAAFEAFEHRAELWHKFELWKSGDADAPTTPEEANALRDRAGKLRDDIAGRQAHLADNLPFDPQFDTLQRQQQERITGYRGQIDEAPAVRQAMAARDVVQRERPETDPEAFAARQAAAQAHADLAAREKMAAHDGYVRAIDKVIAQMGNEDPSAHDAILGGLRAQRDTLQHNLPAGETTSAELKAMDAQIVARLRENQARLDAALDAERRLREQALDALGAPKVTAADVDRADRAKADALDRAKAKQEADRAAADERVAKARADADRAILDRPDVRQAQADLNARRDVVAAKAAAADGRDAEIAKLRAELSKIDGRVSDYDRSTGAAFAMTHPTFTRTPNGVPEAPDFLHPAAPRPGAEPDGMHPAPRTGPAFDLNGPVPDRSAEVVAAIRSSLANLPPAKVEPVHVNGEMLGHAEVATSIAVKVETGPELRGAIAVARYLADIHMSGKMGDQMTGSNGTRPAAPSPAGIGHM